MRRRTTGAAGASFGDVVKPGFYLTDISRMGEVRAVRDEYVDTGNPRRAPPWR